MTDETWIIVEHENGEAKRVALELATQARALAGASGGPVVAVALGPGARQAAAQVVACGVQRVLFSEDDRFTRYSVLPLSRTLARLIEQRQPRLVLFGGTPLYKDVAGRVAARLGCGLLANVVDVSMAGGAVHAIKPAFGGTVQVQSTFVGVGPHLLLARPNAFPVLPVGEPAAAAAVAEIEPDLDERSLLAQVLDRVSAGTAPVSLEEAQIIVAGGRGLGAPAHFLLLQELAEALGGQVGASRAAVDAGWIGYAHQVGQTGKSVRPRLYIACGISGAIQHKVGMQTSGLVVAINRNPDAPVFQFADLGIVGDLFQVVPALTAEVRRRKAR